MSKHIAEQIHEYPTSAKELAWLFLGKVIGVGMSRSVYEYTLDKTLVVKYEHGESRWQNIIEYEIWQTVKDTKMAKWFAPCIDISPNGHFMLQKRAEKIPKGFYPKKIPTMFADLKYDNFGMIGKQFVCIDYGTAHIDALNRALKMKKTKKADWWED